VGPSGQHKGVRDRAKQGIGRVPMGVGTLYSCSDKEGGSAIIIYMSFYGSFEFFIRVMLLITCVIGFLRGAWTIVDDFRDP